MKTVCEQPNKLAAVLFHSGVIDEPYRHHDDDDDRCPYDDAFPVVRQHQQSLPRQILLGPLSTGG
jgi:hypothetical protein